MNYSTIGSAIFHLLSHKHIDIHTYIHHITLRLGYSTLPCFVQPLLKFQIQDVGQVKNLQ